MKNILIVSGVFLPEPVTTALMNYDLAMELSKKNHVTVVHPVPTRPLGKDYSGYDGFYPFDCITLKSYTCPESKLFGRLRESFSFGKACALYIKKHKSMIDVVYNASWQLLGYNIVAKVCKKNNIPYVIPIQDIYPECIFTHKKYPQVVKKLLIKILLPIDRYSQKHAAKIRTISKEMAEYLSKTRRIPIDRYFVLDNWQNDDDFFYEPIANQKITFGYVGSVNAHSNTELIIQAFAKANLPECNLFIYGGGNHKKKCENLAKKLNLRNVFFYVVEKKEVPKVQSSMSVLVLALPTGNGGLCLPSKMISYMLSGRPILASVEESSTTRYIKEADCGLFVEPDNVECLVKGFIKFASMDLQDLNRLGLNSRKFAENRLTRMSNLPKVVDALLNIK